MLLEFLFGFWTLKSDMFVLVYGYYLVLLLGLLVVEVEVGAFFVAMLNLCCTTFTEDFKFWDEVFIALVKDVFLSIGLAVRRPDIY